MASKYLQKFAVPPNFQQILADFTRQVLRDQPANIIEYAAKYFEMLEKGQKMEFYSKYNVKKQDKKYELSHNPRNAEQITKKAVNVTQKVNQSGAQAEPSSQKSMTGQQVNNYMDELNAQVDRKSKIEAIASEIFDNFDSDNSGYLDVKQTRNLLQAIIDKANLNFVISEQQVREFTQNVDTNSNGMLCKKQIITFLSGFLKDFV